MGHCGTGVTYSEGCDIGQCRINIIVGVGNSSELRVSKERLGGGGITGMLPQGNSLTDRYNGQI